MLPPGPQIPALLKMMSSLPFHFRASSTADATSFSFETSQWMYLLPAIEFDKAVPSASRMSAITTFAPFSANNFAVAAPIPLAPPVMIATLPSNLQEKRNQ